MKQELNPLWLKAAVAGGLWASFEIIVGSMLHNLHLPFSGSILTALSVVLMMAFLQIWKEHGIIWRAGLICGLMKSLSPSAVILGPMTGIMLEALLMEVMIMIMGLNFLAYLMAGIAAMLSAILHKLVNLVILYGNDLLTIYNNLFLFLKKQLNWQDASAEGVILTIGGIYVIVGIVAAATGYLLGRSALRSHQQQQQKEPIKAAFNPFDPAWQVTSPDRPFRLFLLFIHMGMIPLMLILVNRYGLGLPSLIPAAIYLGFLLVYYRRIKYRLMKPFFWSQLLIMTLVAGFFWHPPEDGNFRFQSGFLVGLEMSLRALLIVSSFSALSVEFRNPRIGKTFSSSRFKHAFAALSLAFNSLPVMLDRSAGLKSFLRHPLRSFTRLVYDAESWLQCYQTHLDN